MWVVVGLGNPGRRHAGSRHNVGFRVVDRLAARWSVTIADAVDGALVGFGRCADVAVLLVKPQTFMNASGEALAAVQRSRMIASDRLLVVHDDVDLPIGRLRLRAGGGAGGHKGVASIMDVLGDGGFLRLKVGVGRPAPGTDTAAYVLAPPAGAEATALEEAESRAAEAVEIILAQGPARAMNRVNQREASHGGSPL